LVVEPDRALRDPLAPPEGSRRAGARLNDVSVSVVKEEIMEQSTTEPKGGTTRRSLLAKGVAAGTTIGAAGMLADVSPAFAWGRATRGDVAILRFLAAAEILETDLWQQYNELGGIQDSEVPGGSGSPEYTEALEAIDDDMPQYIHDNTDDEISHFTFLNGYLASNGFDPVDLDKFRTLPSSQASGAQQIGRLTNLMQLSVDTSWYTRYRSDDKNPDFGDSFP
jgi:hypothetical protein